MLWSIDMLKPNFPVLPPRDTISGARLLTPSDSSSHPCALCHDLNVHSDVTIDYNGEMVSCSDVHTMLTSNFIPILSDQCHAILSNFGGVCCVNEFIKTCDICGPGAHVELVKNRRVSYAGTNSTCGDLSASFHLLTKESSFSCSVARNSLTSSCCEESCQMCPSGGEMNADGMIDHEGKQISCGNYELILKTSGFLKGSDECNSSASRFLNICCPTEVKINKDFSLDRTPSLTTCNICQRNNVHHELKSEALVPYKGTSISCLDLNSILAKSETYRSEMCTATQTALFDGCCYEKCSLCGDKSLRFDATVKYNNQILSCDELGAMFSMGSVREDDDQCADMQGAYSRSCCFKPPEKKCNLCSRGSSLHEVNRHSFVKTRSSSIHCVNFVNGLAEREEEGSDICIDSKSDHFATCCIDSSFSTAEATDGADNLHYDWFANHMMPSSSDVLWFLTVSFWSSIMTFLHFIL